MLSGNMNGSHSIAIGTHPGNATTTGSNNFEIASRGVSGDTGTICVGTLGTRTQAFLGRDQRGDDLQRCRGAGQQQRSTGGGVVLCALREGIEYVGDQREKLAQLCPVSYRYTVDPIREKQFRLIVEAVAKDYPEIVVRETEEPIESVQYRPPIQVLLDEVKRQQAARSERKQQSTHQQAVTTEQIKINGRPQQELHDLKAQVT